MSTEQLTEDIAKLNSIVVELQRKVAFLEAKPKDNWLPAVLGRFKDDPEFDELVRLGKEFRETGRFPDDEVE